MNYPSQAAYAALGVVYGFAALGAVGDEHRNGGSPITTGVKAAAAMMLASRQLPSGDVLANAFLAFLARFERLPRSAF